MLPGLNRDLTSITIFLSPKILLLTIKGPEFVIGFFVLYKPLQSWLLTPLLRSLQTLHLKVTLICSVAHPVGHSSWPSRSDSLNESPVFTGSSPIQHPGVFWREFSEGK